MDLPPVEVDTATPDGMLFSDFSTSTSKVILSLRMTNRHLKEWACNEESFISKKIDGNVVKLCEPE